MQKLVTAMVEGMVVYWVEVMAECWAVILVGTMANGMAEGRVA